MLIFCNLCYRDDIKQPVNCYRLLQIRNKSVNTLTNVRVHRIRAEGKGFKMKSFKKKAAALILMITAFTMAVPYFDFDKVYASSHIYKASQMNAYDFTSSPELAKKLTQVFNGNIGLYSSSSCSSQTKAPLGCSKMTGSNKFYIKNNTTGSKTFGWQCYIYANAVYNTLYNEWAGNGSSFKHSKVVIKGGSTFSYRQFVNAGVRVGAYVRTTANKDGSYNRSKAHSFVILGYNEEYVTYIDGNSDGRGLVRVNKLTWKELNRWQTTGCGRRICHVVQPTDKYFDSLYGTKKASSGSSSTTAKVKKEAEVKTETTTKTASTSNTAVDPDSIKVKYSRLLSYKKNSKVLSGNDVLYVQTALKYLGYNVSTNSKYDSNTAKIVKQFQKDKKIDSDGIVGKQTWNTIESAVKAKKNSGKTVTVNFNANGGKNAPSNQKMTAGKSTALSKTEPSRDGYTFEGWAKSKTATKADYKAGAKITVSADTTLYAVWKVKTVKTEVTKTESVKSETVSSEAVKITKQPTDVKATEGNKTTFRLTATGSELTYKWYYKKSGASDWTYWPGHDYASTHANANKSWDGMQVYCVVTDGSGNSVKSDVITVTVA